jgi:hypothetical protein
MTLSTVPGMTVLDLSTTPVLSALSSAILAEFDMRGSAISALTLAVRALHDSFLCLFIDSFEILVVLKPS